MGENEVQHIALHHMDFVDELNLNAITESLTNEWGIYKQSRLYNNNFLPR